MDEVRLNFDEEPRGKTLDLAAILSSLTGGSYVYYCGTHHRDVILSQKKQNANNKMYLLFELQEDRLVLDCRLVLNGANLASCLRNMEHTNRLSCRPHWRFRMGLRRFASIATSSTD